LAAFLVHSVVPDKAPQLPSFFWGFQSRPGPAEAFSVVATAQIIENVRFNIATRRKLIYSDENRCAGTAFSYEFQATIWPLDVVISIA
jgi:hypothetical protein